MAHCDEVFSEKHGMSIIAKTICLSISVENSDDFIWDIGEELKTA